MHEERGGWLYTGRKASCLRRLQVERTEWRGEEFFVGGRVDWAGAAKVILGQQQQEARRDGWAVARRGNRVRQASCKRVVQSWHRRCIPWLREREWRTAGMGSTKGKETLERNDAAKSCCSPWKRYAISTAIQRGSRPHGPSYARQRPSHRDGQ